MKNLCALMGYLVLKEFFFNALLPLVLAFSFPFIHLTLTLAPLQQKVRPLDSCIACNILVMEMRLKSKFMIEHIH
jgi:hypothetical protein